MFTGIVENVGKVASLREGNDSWLMELIHPFESFDGLEQGASLSVNGCCLTLKEQVSTNQLVSFDLLDETIQRTNLGNLQPGQKVNLERSLPANGRLGGHFVSGHVDACGEVLIFEERGKNFYLQVKIPSEYSRYLVDKGCIALDGCSLTVCEVEEDSFAVWLIPHTLTKTNLVNRNVGDRLNLEFDLLAKYVEKFALPNVNRRPLK